MDSSNEFYSILFHNLTTIISKIIKYVPNKLFQNNFIIVKNFMDMQEVAVEIMEIR